MLRSAILLLALLASPAPAANAPAVPGYPGVGPFAMPALAEQERAVALLVARGETATALAALDRLIEVYPQVPAFPARRALLAARLGEPEAALADLTRAVDLGFAGIARLATLPVFAPLADDPRLAALLARSPAPSPAPRPVAPALVRSGRAPVGPENTRWNPATGMLESRFIFPPILRYRPLAGARPPPALAELAALVARGRAAGNAGDLYDNRDDGHSALNPERHPQLGFTDYGPEARAAGVHYGLNTSILFDAVTFGNSSTALTGGVFWRSQPRLALTSPGGVAALWRQYASNHLYVYPAHRDHDPERAVEGGSPGFGDLFPANTPYVLISQGSSGSDQPLLEAVAAILAAFKPEVKAFLRERGLIAPTVQMIFRRSQRQVTDAAAYMGPLAHPSAFRAGDIDLPRMIARANALSADTVPPAIRMRVIEEDRPRPGRDYFARDISEALFDTPSAIARIWRSTASRRRMVLDAGASRDPNGRALSFHWRVLRGDGARIAIRRLDDTGARVEITLPWHERAPVPGRSELSSDRVDIAVFADNGAELSAPGFLSLLFPGNQARSYDAEGRILSVDYTAPGYADPLLFPARDWLDRYEYDGAGHLLGWTRRRGDRITRFTRDGLLVLEEDALGRPVRAERVAYPATPAADGRPVIAEEPTGDLVIYRYAGPGDRIGSPEHLARP